MTWRDEERQCKTHGKYMARIVYIKGEQVSPGVCPECERDRALQEAQREAEERAKREAEKLQRKITEALGRACIPADFKDKSFETFQADSKELQDALNLSRRFVKGWKAARAGGYGLFFYGNPGTGKSHLAISIIKELVPGISALYTRVPDMIGYIRSTWHAGSNESAYQAVRRYADLDLLVLDELGIQAGTANEQSILFEVIDSRLAENRPTIFLSNFAPKELSSIIGVRLIDRIKGKCVPQKFTGQSRRKPLSADVFGVAA